MHPCAAPLDEALAALVVLQRAEKAGEEHLMATVATAVHLAGLLVTSRHVLDRNPEVHLRLGDGPDPARFRLSTRTPDGAPLFAVHPREEVDLGAIRPRLPPGGLPPGLTEECLVDQGNGLRTGDPVLVAGFHPDVAPAGAPCPVVRRGTVAVAPPSHFGGGEGFLIDAGVVPGMSGSAVLVERPGGVLLAGIVEGYLPSRRALVDPRSGRPAVLVEESSGFAVVIAAPALRDLLRPRP